MPSAPQKTFPNYGNIFFTRTKSEELWRIISVRRVCQWVAVSTRALVKVNWIATRSVHRLRLRNNNFVGRRCAAWKKRKINDCSYVFRFFYFLSILMYLSLKENKNTHMYICCSYERVFFLRWWDELAHSKTNDWNWMISLVVYW